MSLAWRYSTAADLPLLAEWNHQLIRDEGHRNPMTVAQLAERMRTWLQQEYQAVIFSDGEPVGYALYCNETDSVYLRHLFVRRDRRSAGIGGAAVAVLKQEIWPKDVRLTVAVLCENQRVVAFWRKAGYRDYCLTLEITPGPKSDR